MDAPKQVLACIPAMFKDFPKFAPYSQYHVGKCGTCSTELWIGENGQRLIDAGVAIAACPNCVIAVHHVSPEQIKEMQTLTGDGNA